MPNAGKWHVIGARVNPVFGGATLNSSTAFASVGTVSDASSVSDTESGLGDELDRTLVVGVFVVHREHRPVGQQRCRRVADVLPDARVVVVLRGHAAFADREFVDDVPVDAVVADTAAHA